MIGDFKNENFGKIQYIFFDIKMHFMMNNYFNSKSTWCCTFCYIRKKLLHYIVQPTLYE